MAKRKKELDARTFDALSDAEKAKIIADIEAEDPADRLARSKPLTRQQRADWRRRTKMGRPKIGQGHKVVSISLEAGLLKKADAYAKRHGLKRAQLVAQSLRTVIGEGPSRPAA
jgi:hypothetical protein